MKTRIHNHFGTIPITHEMIEEVLELENQTKPVSYAHEEKGSIADIAARLNRRRREMYG